MTRYMRYLRAQYRLELHDYDELYHWSVQQPGAFWSTVWEFCGVRAQGALEPAVVNPDRMPGASWFPNVRVNFAANLLRFRDEREALVGVDELGQRRSWTYAALYDDVAAVAQRFKALGLTPGDRVAAFVPNTPETIILMLAATSLGAVWTSCSPDFGTQGVLDRFGQVAPKLLITSDGYRYGGKSFDSLSKIAQLLPELPSVERIIVYTHIQAPKQCDLGALHASAERCIWLHDVLAERCTTPIHFAPLEFSHPLYILYSSGTTGVPKCIVHGTGGVLLQHLKELVLHTDVRREDHLLYYTTCGWMMWNWMVSTLAVGATLVVYDGSPSHPTPAVLWDLVEREQVSVFGTSAKWLSASEKADIKPKHSHRLFRLRAVLSTGSPLSDESFEYVYRDVHDNVLLASISGGTDIVSCFALGCPIRPVYRGELQCRGLGMKVEILDDDGKAQIGSAGELSCTLAFPSMPVAFLSDPDGSKYHAAYFDKFPNTWCHGDHATLNARGGLVIHGRSDATLNPGGVRIGTAEIYRQVEKLPEVLESLAVGQEWDNDVRVILFVRLRPELQLDEALSKLIKSTIRSNTTPRHVPAKIIQVQDLPRTRSGKITELAVRQVIHNRPVKNTDALANPEALQLYANLPELQ
jgi:acetoacetyl-CoA synthetase